MAFPPIPVYPDAIDTDYSLFLVHNTTESRLSADNVPWSQEIDIVPVDSDKPEIWADNGFGNIDGELFYYDSVEKNEYDRVVTLKNCSRQLGGKTKFHAKGTWVRSYVIAEHHNQFVNCILKMEDFIGYNYDPNIETLDWRIRNLEALEVVFDDSNCPDVSFTFNVISDDPVTGKVATFFVEVVNAQAVFNFRLDFGDGTSTTEMSGTHRYAVNTTVDPVLVITNDLCEIIQTPAVRLNPSTLPEIIEDVFEIPIPECPICPNFTFVPCDVPPPTITPVPLVTPCATAAMSEITITGPSINLVSQVTITGPDINMVSTVTIEGEIPNVIVVDHTIPPTIIIEPPIPPTIIIVPPQSEILLELNATELPRLEVDWGLPPEMTVMLNMSRPVQKMKKMQVDPMIANEFGAEFSDLFEATSKMEVEYEPVGIPSEIKIIPPEIPNISLDTSNIPRTIRLESHGVNLPPEIKIYGPENPIPDRIVVDGINIPTEIGVVNKGIPERILVETVTPFPEKIMVEQTTPIPERIIVEPITPIPERIVIEGSIPEKISVEITGFPEGIPVLFPEKMPEMELVYKGAPIEVKITMDQILTQTPDGKNCVMITPCPV